MRHIILLAAVLVAIQTQAQTISSSVDEFSGIEVRETSIERLTKGQQVDTYFKFAKAEQVLVLYLDAALQSGNVIFSVRKGDRLQFKLSNGEVVTLNAHKGAVSRRGRVESAAVMYVLDEDAIAALTASNVEKLRIHTSKGAWDEDVKQKHAEVLREALAMLR